jgi:hypothetical protein
LPLNAASPVELSRTDGVSTRTELPPLALPSTSHTSVPFTPVIGPGVPIVIPRRAASKNQTANRKLKLSLAQIDAGRTSGCGPGQKTAGDSTGSGAHDIPGGNNSNDLPP